MPSGKEEGPQGLRPNTCGDKQGMVPQGIPVACLPAHVRRECGSRTPDSGPHTELRLPR